MRRRGSEESPGKLIHEHVMDAFRARLHGELESSLKNQRHFVESLRKQNDLYEEEIRIHEGQQALLSGGRRDLEERLEALGAEETALGREVERLSMEHERLVRDIAAWKEDGIQQQLAAIRAEKPRFNFAMLRRRIQNLRSAIEFKEANIAHTLAKARDDRHEIDRLRAVRVLQDDAMRRMEGELVEAEKALDAQRARAAEAREECDEARYSVVARFRDIVQEQAAFDRDLDFTRDQFLSESKRLRARKSGRAARTTEEQRAEQAEAFRHQGILSIEDEAALRADLEVLRHENEDRRAATAVLREQIHRRRMRLEGLRSMVGAEDDEAMKRVFEDMEERLSSLHRQGQTVAREMDKLQTSVRVLRTERDGLRAELIGVAGPRLADLVRARVEDTRQIRRQHRRRAEVMTDMVNELMEKMQRMLSMLGHSTKWLPANPKEALLSLDELLTSLATITRGAEPTTVLVRSPVRFTRTVDVRAATGFAEGAAKRDEAVALRGLPVVLRPLARSELEPQSVAALLRRP